MIDETMYFSPAEFLVMLELSGSSRCLVLLQPEEPDDEELTLAFASLFRRGLIRREGDGFRVSGGGELFSDLRSAPWAVLIADGEGNRALCYAGGDRVCLVEPVDMILRRQYRVRRLDPEQLRDWLFEAQLLHPPVLQAEDAAELDALLEQSQDELPGDVLLRMEKHRNAGGPAETFEVRRWSGGRLIACTGPEGLRYAAYTAQSLQRMLEACFGKENHDYC